MTPKLRFPEFNDNWTIKSITELADTSEKYSIVDGPFGSNLKRIHYRNEGVPIVTSGYVTSGRFYAEEYLYVTNEKFLKEKRSAVKGGDIVMAKIGANCGASAILPINHKQGILSGNALKISIDKRNNSTYFIWSLLWHLHSSNKLDGLKTVGAQPSLSMVGLKKFKLVVPDKSEQLKIASLLSAVDQKINLLTKKKEALESYKKGLMQKIFSQELRFKREDGTVYPEWESLSFSAVFDRVKRKNKNGLETVLTISAQLGLVDPTEYFSRDVSSSDKSNYTLLHRNEFAYNKSYSKGYPLGAIKRNTRYNVGVLSPLYICFACKNEAFVEYYEHYFESGIFNKQIYRIAQEGARNHGLLNVSVTEFFEDTTLKHPSKEESLKIRDILTKFDALITSVSEKLGAAEQLKKGLLQQMFV